MSKFKVTNPIVAKTITLFLVSLSLMNTACTAKEVEELSNNSVGGTVTGLNGKLVLMNNNSDEIEVTSDGEFIFPSELGISNRYQVSVAEQPVGQTCSIQNASGVITISEVRDVVVVCSTITHFIGFTVTGLTGSVALLNIGTDVTTITADGSYSFPTYLAHGAVYSVTIQAQPSGQTCVVTNGAGIANSDVTDIIISCGP